MSDLDYIKQIEKELEIELKLLDQIEWDSRGYTVNQGGAVVEVALYNCEICDITSIIVPLAALTCLATLNMGHNLINDLTPLAALTHLTTLKLCDNQISNLMPLATLTRLTSLNMGSNRICDLRPLVALTHLTTLKLYDNQISDLTPLTTLTYLTTLHLSNNHFSDLTPLAALTQLTELYLYDNQISDLTPLKNLKYLRRLSIYKNPIEILPAWITDFAMDIQWKEYGDDGYISLYENPLITPPPEIVKQGKDAIRNYFQQLQAQAEDRLFEAKLLILGEPGAGKTSLTRKIQCPTCALPEEDETTKGIDVTPYYFPLAPDDVNASKSPDTLKDREFRLNLWDFGGQEIYKATHRFFLSHRSLYALLANSRNEDTDFNYWLHLVEMFGGDSPLLIVLNEKHGRKRHLDVAAMRARFGNIVEVLEVDFAESDPARLAKLTKAIKHHVSNLPHIGSPVPAKWAEVREALEQDARTSVTQTEYLEICARHGITKRDDALVLSQYFHDIGVFLHFQDDDLLAKTVFLKPNWATNAVYQLLDAPLLNQTNGRFTKQEAAAIWQDAEHAPFCAELLRMMHKFFLAYEIDRSGAYIVPERLPAAAPQYAWESRDNLRLQYHYDYFMPKGLLSQFIVQMHRYIRNHDLVWRRGVMLEREGTQAEITETYDARTINIRLAGKHRRDFMTLIAEQFDHINGQYEKMAVDKLIPCNCDECKTVPEPYFYEYKDLQRRIEKGRQEVECGQSYTMVNVRGLIDDVLNSPDTAPRSSVNEMKRKRLEQELERYQQQYDAVSQQKMNDINAMNQVKQQNQLDDLERKMRDIEQQLSALQAFRFSP